MARSYLRNQRNRAQAASQPQNTILGFLDINFGVLGIFLIVFTIRLVVVAQPAGFSPDLILVAGVGDTPQSTSIEIYRLDGAEPTRFIGKTEEFQTYLSEVIKAETDTGLASVRLLVLVPAAGFKSERFISIALNRIERSYGDGYRPFVSALRPVLGPEHIAALVAAWQEGEL